MTEISVGEAEVALLDKYCNPKLRPGVVEAIADRILHEWALRAAFEWAHNKSLIPELPMSRDAKVMSVKITYKTASDYFHALKLVEIRQNVKLDPVALATWLFKMFIKTWNLKKKTEGYTHDFGFPKRK